MLRADLVRLGVDGMKNQGQLDQNLVQNRIARGVASRLGGMLFGRVHAGRP